MPEFRSGSVSLAFDLCGCPNRCRHCWLGQASAQTMDRRQAVDLFTRFRSRVAENGAEVGVHHVKYFGSYFREPHLCAEYRSLRQLELKLNGGIDYAADYQLLSVWRLAHDAEYAGWAKSINTRKCQIALFGLEGTNDWFCRRKGAHQDILTATNRLLEVGIQPRWMIFLNRRGLPELPGVLELVEQLHLRERVAEIGGEFDLFLNDPTPIGEAERLQDLRLIAEDIERIPAELVRSTERYFSTPFRPRTASEWTQGILDARDVPIGLDYPAELWFFVASDWSVYPNIGTLEPWWKLGNLATDSPDSLLRSFRDDVPDALKAGTDLTLHEAAERFSEPDDRHLYTSKTDLTQLWHEMHCRAFRGQ